MERAESDGPIGPVIKDRLGSALSMSPEGGKRSRLERHVRTSWRPAEAAALNASTQRYKRHSCDAISQVNRLFA